MSKKQYNEEDFSGISDMLEGKHHVIPIVSNEDEEEAENTEVPDTLPILTLRSSVLFPGSMLGVEAASIFAIFTSQAWNMAFSFTRSLTSEPTELDEAARSLQLTRWQRFWTLDVPNAMIPLLWNCMMSVGGGWFFLTASEMISVNNRTYALPGIGSFVAQAAAEENLAAICWAIVTMVLVVLLIDVLLWKPLTAWAEKFRITQSESAVRKTSVVLTISTVALTRPMMQLMQTPDDIIDGAVIYIGWIFAGIPFIFLYNMVAAIMRALGDSKTPLYFLILTSALNIGLDLLFIVPFHFGVLGAALATDISQVISGVLSFIYLRRKFDVLKMEKDDLAFSKKASIRLLGIGVPMGLQCSITAIGSVIMQWAVNVLGSTAVAAVTAAGKTQGLLTVPMESVGTAMATYAGQNLGASRMDRVRQGVNSAMLIILIYGVASAFVLHFTDVQIMGLFLDTAKEVDIVAMGREYLFWNSVFFVPLGALIVWRYSIQGLGFSSLAMLAGVAEMVARTAVAIVLVPILGYFGAELSNPAAWIAACLFLYPAYRWTCRQLDNRLLAARLHIQGDHAETVL